MIESLDQQENLPRQVGAVFYTFIVNGAVFGTWVSRIPAIQTKLSLSEAALGIVLLGLSAGVMAGLALASGWIVRLGSKTVAAYSCSVMCLILPGLALAENAAALWPLLFLFGGAASVMDVAMNDQAVFVERLARRPFMSRFHGAFSIGGLIGALLGAAFAGANVTPVVHFITISILFGLGMMIAARQLLPQTEVHENPGPAFCIPDRALWGIGAVALISAVAEGAMADWSAVYLAEVLDSTEGTAALGFAAYSMAMTAARLSGDHLKTRFSPINIVRTGGLIAAAGLVVVVFSSHAALTLAGFTIIGLGLANIIPIAFTAAGNYPGIPSSIGIAAVAAIGYTGFLASPPVIGLLAHATSLRIAFATMVVLLVTLPAIASAVSAKKS
ncbi:MAG: MFS transporter [Verrucomicrobiales bacterium]